MNESKSSKQGGTLPASIIADIYARWTLDCVIDLVTAIAEDYQKRYLQYRAVPNDLSSLLIDFRTKTGSEPEWPNSQQRAAIFTPLLGPCDRKPGLDRGSPVREASAALRAAAIAYSERVFNTGEPMLKDAFVNAAKGFYAQLSTLCGSVVDAAQAQTEPMFWRATRVLSAGQVTQAFGGLPPAPSTSWPLPRDNKDGAYLDGNADYLIYEVSRTLQIPDGAVKQQQFISLQRVAVAGARTMKDALNFEHESDDPERVRRMIGNAYTWSTALRDLSGSR